MAVRVPTLPLQFLSLPNPPDPRYPEDRRPDPTKSTIEGHGGSRGNHGRHRHSHVRRSMAGFATIGAGDSIEKEVGSEHEGTSADVDASVQVAGRR